MSDAIQEAQRYILAEKDPEWLAEIYINEEIGKF